MESTTITQHSSLLTPPSRPLVAALSIRQLLFLWKTASQNLQSLHLQWVVLAAQKKKHILLEKPFALNVGELDIILEACESSGVQFMDPTMWMHHLRTTKMKEFISDQQKFGQIKSVHNTFSYIGDENFQKNNICVNPNLDSLRALGDAGWYSIRAILWAHDYELPNTVTALQDTEFNESGVILSCGASLNWTNDKKIFTLIRTGSIKI
ncbi:uncharacterized oxidoreductase [Tanacetum coccineum]